MFNVWTPYGSVDASAKRCEAKGHQRSPVGNTAFMFLPKGPVGTSFTPPVGSLDINVWTYALMPRGINVHTYSVYVHVWSFTPYVWTLNRDI